MKRIIKICLGLALMLAMADSVNAFDALAVDDTVFKDPIFKEYVSANFDKNQDGFLEEDEIASATKITIRNSTLMDLAGIEYLEDLTSIELHDTAVVSLDLSSNTNLEEVYLGGSALKELRFSFHPYLTQLAIQNTGISELDLSKLPSLNNLVITDSPGISSLDFKDNTDLRSLMIDGSNIKRLDLSKQSLLGNIHLTNLGLEDLNIGRNEALSYISLSGNTALTALDLSLFPSLSSLDISNTGIKVIDLKDNPSLEYLNARNAALIGLDTQNNPRLRYLDLRGCPLAYLNASNVRSLYYDKNTYPEITVYGKEYPINEVLKYFTFQKAFDVNGIKMENAYFKDYQIGTNAVSYKYDLGSGNYLAVSLKVTALKGETKIEVSELNKVYDGKAYVPKIQVTGSNAKPVYTISGGDGINAGDYVLTVKVAEDDFYKAKQADFNIEITKAVPDVYIERGISKKYDGKPIDNIKAITDSDGIITYTYEILDNSGWHTFNGIPTNAGIYRVTANVKEGRNYVAATSQPHTFMIARVLSHIELTKDLDKIYDGKNVVVPEDLINMDAEGQVVLEWFEIVDGRYILMNEAPINVGEYELVAFRLEDRDHYGSITYDKVSISKAYNKWLSAFEVSDSKFGEALNITPPKAQFGEVILEYAKKKDGPYTTEIPVDIGTYYVRATVKGNNNYNGMTSEAMRFSIIGDEVIDDKKPIIIPDTSAAKINDLIIITGVLAILSASLIYLRRKNHQ